MSTLIKTTLAAMIAMGLSACGPETQQEASQDVAEARQEGAENLAEVRQDAQEDIADARQDAANDGYGLDGNRMGNDGLSRMGDNNNEVREQTAEAEYDIAVTKAESRLEVAQEQCDTLTGDAHDRCEDEAQMQYENEKQLAEQRLDAATNDNVATTDYD